MALLNRQLYTHQHCAKNWVRWFVINDHIPSDQNQRLRHVHPIGSSSVLPGLSWGPARENTHHVTLSRHCMEAVPVWRGVATGARLFVSKCYYVSNRPQVIGLASLRRFNAGRWRQTVYCLLCVPCNSMSLLWSKDVNGMTQCTGRHLVLLYNSENISCCLLQIWHCFAMVFSLLTAVI